MLECILNDRIFVYKFNFFVLSHKMKKLKNIINENKNVDGE